jgi:hypothetical protein
MGRWGCILLAQGRGPQQATANMVITLKFHKMRKTHGLDEQQLAPLEELYPTELSD